MGQLTRYTVKQLKQDLARTYGNMELATRVALAGMNEITQTHTYGAEKVSQTLATAQRVVDTAGAMSPVQQRQVHYRTQRYLSDMLQIADTTAASIVSRLR